MARCWSHLHAAALTQTTLFSRQNIKSPWRLYFTSNCKYSCGQLYHKLAAIEESCRMMPGRVSTPVLQTQYQGSVLSLVISENAASPCTVLILNAGASWMSMLGYALQADFWCVALTHIC